MKISSRWLQIIITLGISLIVTITISCNRGLGQDSILFSTTASGSDEYLECDSCHMTGSSFDPLASGGSGAAGKHIVHVSEVDIGCAACHNGYDRESAHMNDSGETTGMVSVTGVFRGIEVSFDYSEPGNCSNISCHGSGTNEADWYDDFDGGGCLACHSSGSAIDPLTTGGSGITGKHAAHVTEGGAECAVCHNGYKLVPTHLDGSHDMFSITTFGGYFAGQAVAADFSEPGNCSNISCHGTGSSPVDWYSESSEGCMVCHTMEIEETDHDFSSEAWSDGMHCQVCHEAHSFPVNELTWNHELSAASYTIYAPSTLDAVDIGQPQDNSLLCLSCHDGTVAVDSFGGKTGTYYLTGDEKIGTDLTEKEPQHPVSYTYDAILADPESGDDDFEDLFDPTIELSGLGDTIAADMLFGPGKNRFECSSCHAVHGSSNEHLLKLPVTESGGGGQHPSGTLCHTCHITSTCTLCHDMHGP